MGGRESVDGKVKDAALKLGAGASLESRSIGRTVARSDTPPRFRMSVVRRSVQRLCQSTTGSALKLRCLNWSLMSAMVRCTCTLPTDAPSSRCGRKAMHCARCHLRRERIWISWH